MTIASLADYRSALRERPLFTKTGARSQSQGVWYTFWDGTGTPAAGTLSAGNTANGVVPTDATTGAFSIGAGGGDAYLTEVEGFLNVLGRVMVYDRLFHAGAYAFNASTSLTSQPSYSSRVPGGSYNGLQLWVECVTTFTGSLSLAVTYTDQSGNTGQSTGTVVVGALTIGQMVQMPLASGDMGLSKIESVTATVASAGTFNVLVARPLWRLSGKGAIGFNDNACRTERHWLDMTMMPLVFGDSCVAAMFNWGGTDSATATPTADLAIEIASK